MCTVTVQRSRGRLVVTMSRDERRDRLPEEPPSVRSAHYAWAAPRDGAAGGTWFAVSAAGVVGCILNRYQDEFVPPKGRVVPSRGEVLRLLCEHEEPRDTSSIRGELSQFAPFTLLLACKSEAARIDWNGARLSRRALAAPYALVTSSSWRTEAVLAWRRRAFAEWRTAADHDERGIPTLHLLAPEGRAEWAPLMSREKSATRSITQAVLDFRKRRADVRYWPVEDGRVAESAHRLALELARR